MTGVHEEEAPGAISVFNHTRLEAGLSKEGGVLVAGDTADADAIQFGYSGHRADDSARGNDAGQQGGGDAEHLQQGGIPLARMNVHEEGAGGVGDIGHVQRTTGEIPKQPSIDGSKAEFPLFGAVPGVWNVIENPCQLGAGKIRIQEEARFRADFGLQTVLFEFLALGGGAPVLPDDGWMDGLAARSFPDHCGFPLVGDADRSDIGGLQTRFAERLHGDTALGLPDFDRVMLDPSRLRIGLPEGFLRDAHRLAPVIEDDGAGAGGPLVKCEQVGW